MSETETETETETHPIICRIKFQSSIQQNTNKVAGKATIVCNDDTTHWLRHTCNARLNMANVIVMLNKMISLRFLLPI